MGPFKIIQVLSDSWQVKSLLWNTIAKKIKIIDNKAKNKIRIKIKIKPKKIIFQLFISLFNNNFNIF